MKAFHWIGFLNLNGKEDIIYLTFLFIHHKYLNY